MRNGGYQAINLRDRNLSLDGAPAVCEGIYECIENSYRKPILLTGITIDEVEKNDAFVVVEVSGRDYHLIMGSLTIVVSPNDEVEAKTTSMM